MSKPNTLAIVTAVKGNPPELVNTLNSLRHHLTPHFTWVIKFNQDTKSEFQQIFQGIEHVETTKISDQSLYEGLNQALQILKTKYYFVMGAGDSILTDGVLKLKNMLGSTNTHSDGFLFPIYFRHRKSIFRPDPSKLRERMSCPHPGAILLVDESLKLGGFTNQYRIAGDYDHLSRYFLTPRKVIIQQDVPLVDYMGGGLSDVCDIEAFIEEELIRLRVWGITDLEMMSNLQVNFSIRQRRLITSIKFPKTA